MKCTVRFAQIAEMFFPRFLPPSASARQRASLVGHCSDRSMMSRTVM